MIIRTLLSTSLALAVLSGCGPAPTPGRTGDKKEVKATEATGPADLFPLTVGNAWTYLVNVETEQQGRIVDNKAFERTFKVEKVEDTAEGTVGSVTIYDEKQTAVAALKLLVNKEGIFQTTIGLPANERAYADPLPWANWGGEVDSELKYNSRGPLPGTDVMGSIEGANFYRGVLEADAATERFASHCFDSTQKYLRDDGSGMIASQRSWFAPKIGLVRLVEALTNGTDVQRSTWRLKSHTVK